MNDGSKLDPPAKKRYAGGTYGKSILLRKNTTPMQVIFESGHRYASPSGKVITANDETFFNVPSRMVLHTPNYSDSVITEILAHNRFIPVQVGREANNLNLNNPEWQIMKRRWEEGY